MTTLEEAMERADEALASGNAVVMVTRKTLDTLLSALRSRPTREDVAWPTPMDVDRIIEDHWIMGEGPHPDVNEAIIKLFKERFGAPPPEDGR